MSKGWRNPIYKKVQRIAHQMMQAAQARGSLKSWQRPCADCGTWESWTWCDEHRDYSDPYDIVCVCGSCNQKRGPALLMLFNVETAEWEQVFRSAYIPLMNREAHVDTRTWTLARMLRQGVVSESALVCAPVVF